MALTFVTDHTSAGMRALSEQVVRQWNEERPATPVTMAAVDHEELRGQVEELLSGAHPPDVVTWFAGDQTRRLAERSLMLDITRVWSAGGFTSSYPARFQHLATAHGPAYFLPTSCYWWAFYYRPSVFASLGIRAPLDTWPSLLSAFQVLRDAGIAPVAFGARHRCPAAAWFDYLNMRINGPDFHQDLMALRAPYTDGRVSKVFAYWRSLLEQETFLGDPADYDEAEAVSAVLDARAGMTLIGSYISDEYVPEGETDLDYFRFPVIFPELPVGEDSPVDGYFVAGRSAAPEDACAFLAHLGSRKVQQMNVAAMHVLPTRRDVSTRRMHHVAKGARILGRADRLSQFYDLDTPGELADFAMPAFVDFLRDPSRATALLDEMESLRQRLTRPEPPLGRS